MDTLNYIIKILSIIGTVWTVLQAYKIIYYLLFFKKVKFNETNNKHKYAICIAARNEEKVIKNLLESIDQQDYPKDKIKVFVVADNCTDSTYNVVKEYGEKSVLDIVAYKHDDSSEKTKGFALRYLFNQIKKDYGINAFEAYYIFDADNVLASDYLTRMNEAFDTGKDVVVSFRKSKNLSQNWISFSYAMHWIRTSIFENRGKTLLNISCRIQGTGFLFSNKWVQDGWNYTDLTEDRSFCTDIVIKGGTVAYCDAAKFYDEQPYKLKIALRQRLRWSRGHLEAAVVNEPKLIKNIFKFNKNSIRSYDIFWLNFPQSVESFIRKLISFMLKITIGIISIDLWGVVNGMLIALFVNFGLYWLFTMAIAVVTYIVAIKDIERVKFGKLIWYIFMFPFFDKIGTWTSYIALFKKVEWKPIPHDYVVDVKKLK